MFSLRVLARTFEIVRIKAHDFFNLLAQVCPTTKQYYISMEFRCWWIFSNPFCQLYGVARFNWTLPHQITYRSQTWIKKYHTTIINEFDNTLMFAMFQQVEWPSNVAISIPNILRNPFGTLYTAQNLQKVRERTKTTNHKASWIF